MQEMDEDLPPVRGNLLQRLLAGDYSKEMLDDLMASEGITPEVIEELKHMKLDAEETHQPKDEHTNADKSEFLKDISDICGPKDLPSLMHLLKTLYPDAADSFRYALGIPRGMNDLVIDWITDLQLEYQHLVRKEEVLTARVSHLNQKLTAAIEARNELSDSNLELYSGKQSIEIELKEVRRTLISRIRILEHSLASKDDRLNRYESQITEKDAVIAARDSKIAYLESIVNAIENVPSESKLTCAIDKVVTKKDGGANDHHTETQTALTKSNDAFQKTMRLNTQDSVTRDNSRISELADAKTEITALKEKLRAKEDFTGELAKTLEDKDAELKLLQMTLFWRNQEIGRLKTAMAKYTEEKCCWDVAKKDLELAQEEIETGKLDADQIKGEMVTAFHKAVKYRRKLKEFRERTTPMLINCIQAVESVRGIVNVTRYFLARLCSIKHDNPDMFVVDLDLGRVEKHLNYFQELYDSVADMMGRHPSQTLTLPQHNWPSLEYYIRVGSQPDTLDSKIFDLFETSEEKDGSSSDVPSNSNSEASEEDSTP